MTEHSNNLSNSVKRLSSGLRVVNASDDAAGLAVSEKMRRQIRGISRAQLNAQDGISMVQAAEGALGETQSIIQRMRELAVQSSNDTLTSNDRLEIQLEVDQLKQQVDAVAFSSEFNTKKLLNGNQSALITSDSNFVSSIVRGALPENGNYSFSLKTLSGGTSLAMESNILKNRNTGELCTGNTKLLDIDTMYTDSGEFCLETSQKLSVSGNGRKTEFSVDAEMTLNDLAAKIHDAVSSKAGLGMESVKVGITEPAGVNGGKISLVSGISGAKGCFSLSGSNDLMDALGFSVVREAENSQIEVTMTDSYGSKKTAVTSSGEVSSLLEGADIKFDYSAAQISGVGGVTDGIILTSSVKFWIRMSVSKMLQIGIKEGNWSMDGLVDYFNNQIQTAETNRGEKLFLSASLKDGELSFNYDPENSDDKSFSILNWRLSSNGLGITAGRYDSSVTFSKNKDNMIRGIRNIKNRATDETVSLKISDGHGDVIISLTKQASAKVKGKKVADLIEISELIASVNSIFYDKNLSLCLEERDNSLFFTSESSIKNRKKGFSSVNMQIMTGKEGAEEFFGLNNSYSRGIGDSFFNLHVVNNQAGLQIGSDKGDNMNLCIGNMSCEALGIENVDLSSLDAAENSLEKINIALDMVSRERSNLGAFQNRLLNTINNLEVTNNNLIISESRIRDADMAQEVIEYTREQILNSSGISALTYADYLPKGALTLLV